MPGKLLSTTNRHKKSSPGNSYSGKPITAIITNGFFTVDKKWTVTYWNKAAEKLLGVLSKDIIGTNLWEKFAGIIPIEFYKVYHNAFLQDLPVHFEEYWGEMGTWFDVITYHCDDVLSVSFKNSNQPANPVQELKVLTELYRFVTEVTNDCLWEWDLDAKELFWIDGGHKRVFGYNIQNALIPQSFWESRLHPDDKTRILTRLNKIIAGNSSSVWEDEYRFQKADGNYIYVHDRGHIIYNEDKIASRMIGATQDISDRKLAGILLRSGMASTDHKRSILVGKIKAVIIELIHYSEEPLAIKFSEFLSEKLNHDYTYLANVFSEAQGITIEKFFISHKIERVKELLMQNQHTLTEIAYQMHYSSVSHLSAQFKKVTGLTPSYFKQLRNQRSYLAEEV
ncbi:MAG: PAS domain-containing protein [Bacteroidota bacterium]